MPLARRCVRSKLAALAVGLVFVGACSPAPPPPQTAAPASALEAPVLIANVRKGLIQAYGWNLTVWADGRAVLEWRQRDPALNDKYRVWREELDVDAERVAAIMKDAYERVSASGDVGSCPSDITERRLVVRDAGRVGAITLGYVSLALSPDEYASAQRREQVADALELWWQIESLFADPPSVLPVVEPRHLWRAGPGHEDLRAYREQGD
jgi:hypothetical protein